MIRRIGRPCLLLTATLLVETSVWGDVTLDGDGIRLTLDGKGVASLKETASGRELVGQRLPFAAFVKGKGNPTEPLKMEVLGEGRLAFVFPEPLGEVDVQATPFAGGWTFEITKAAATDFGTFEICRIRSCCSKWTGSFANAWSDERSAVCVRSYDFLGTPKCTGYLRNAIADTCPLVGRKTGLAAGPRTGFVGRLRAMTVAAGVPRSDCGGAWSLGSEAGRWNYVFARIKRDDVDYWIDLARRSGFLDLHLNESWGSCWGDYEIRKEVFAGGLAGMADACRRIHDAGLKVGTHTLTGCLSMQSKHLSPVCDSNLVFDATYTLAEPLAADATELVVNERPIDKHALVATYSSNGNYLWANGELMQYTGIRREKPYAFTGLTRTVRKTRSAGALPAGTFVGYPHHRYNCLYPEPGSPLADAVTDRLAEVYNACGMDEIYFDGSEGMGTGYGNSYMRWRTFGKLRANNGHSPIVEASSQGANNWWFQTRTATLDRPIYGMKTFHDLHIARGIRECRLSNFMEPQMGWWEPCLARPRARGHFTDEMEYFAGKNAGHDLAMAIEGLDARPLPFAIRRQLTLLGWYEKPRLAHAYRPSVTNYLAGVRTEGRLRQGSDGVWRFVEAEIAPHRAGSPETRAWTCVSDSRRPVALRVEALYDGQPTNAPLLLAASDFAGMKTKKAPGMTVACAQSAETTHGKALGLSASNRKVDDRTAAWAAASVTYGFPGRNLGKDVAGFSVWVKGDGSGALLNFVLRNVPDFAVVISEHYAKIDFTGWRRFDFLLRERDAGERYRYTWPFGSFPSPVYINGIKPEHFGGVDLYLNDIPKGGTASVEIGEIAPLLQVPRPPTAFSVDVNGQRVDVPFPLASGEYAELDGGAWTRYSELGLPVAHTAASVRPVFGAGTNRLALVAAEGARAEVTTFAFGKVHEALRSTEAPILRFEAVEPFVYDPAHGLAGPTKIRVRPNVTARLSLEVLGPAADPEVTLGATHVKLPSVAAGELLVCRDGTTWKIVTAKDGTTLREGRLGSPLPELTETTSFAFAADVPSGEHAEVDLMKEYANHDK